MKLMAGVISETEAKSFSDSGADELYCGLCLINNHRDPELSVDLAGLTRIIKAARNRRKPVFLAANETYHQSWYPRIVETISDCLAAGLSGLIIRDMGLLSYLRERSVKTRFILSALGCCFNSGALSFYACLGIERITVPQQLTPAEAGRLLHNRLGLETEVFFHDFSYCVNIDGACVLHDFPGAACASHPCLETYTLQGKKFVMPKPSRPEMMRMFYSFYKEGAQYLKTPRYGDFSHGAAVVQRALKLISLAGASASESEFLTAAGR